MGESFAEMPELTPFDARALEADDAAICALDDDLRITYVNSAWREFSRANGAPPDAARRAAGQTLLDACPADTRPFYEELFRRARTASAPVEHSYECSSPTSFRRYRMRIFRCDTGAIQASDLDALVLALEATPFDLVVLGPDMQGGATLETIRALQPTVRVAMVVGAGSTTATVGSATLIRTPFTLQSLVEGVRAALEGSQR